MFNLLEQKPLCFLFTHQVFNKQSTLMRLLLFLIVSEAKVLHDALILLLAGAKIALMRIFRLNLVENLSDKLYGEYITWNRLNQNFWKMELPHHDWNMSLSFQLQSRWINEDWGARRRQMLGNLKISNLTVKKKIGLRTSRGLSKLTSLWNSQ